MVVYCSAYNCKEYFKKGGPVTFHSFPKDERRRRIWEIKTRRENFKANNSTKLCSKHFTLDCFDTQRFGGRWLKETAVPTVFDFPEQIEKKNESKPRGRKSLGPVIEQDKDKNHDTNGASTKVDLDNPALVEIVMNEKFYPPEHLEALANGLESPDAMNERIKSLEENLNAKILLRKLKRQLFESEIKAANIKTDYYTLKRALLPQIQDTVDLENNLCSAIDSSLQNIKRKLKEEELAAQAEEKMLKEQLKKAQLQAAYYEKCYYEATSSQIPVS